SLPAYVGVKGPQGFAVLRVESVQPGNAESKALLASLPAELNQVWGRAEEQAVLKALRTQAAVTMLPEAAEAISGENEARN
ncbi:MAG TPA: peptidylprolyl isomerase, partial [Burkholderiaceae bacterium]|nr:peptidylprolyl isomerase [Burkholderiaceae bacterium]